MGRNVCDSDVIWNSCSSKLYKKLKVDEDVCIDNVSDTSKEQFHERGQALSPKSIPLDIASTPRSHRI